MKLFHVLYFSSFRFYLLPEEVESATKVMFKMSTIYRSHIFKKLKRERKLVSLTPTRPVQAGV
jgi:hypothetical protein